jgi:hypothetical protein
MLRSRGELVDHTRIDRCPVGGDLDRRRALRECAGEEHPRRTSIATWRDQDVDDLPVLIDRAVEVGPAAATIRYVSSTNHRSPVARRAGRAASMNSGVKVCTQRYIVT